MPEWMGIVIRSVAAILYLLFLTRILGKRQLSQMTFFEYIVGITVGSITAEITSAPTESFWDGILALSIVMLLPLVFEFLAMKSKWVRNIIEGNATVLIEHGKVLDKNLRKERLNSEELLETLRMKDVFRVADVEFALLEPSGQISVLLKEKTLGRQMPQTVILDGVVIDRHLEKLGVDRKWLDGKLQEKGIAQSSVFLAQVDGNMELYVDQYGK
ncbi:hypothetical protein CBW65_14490 [Tumebacillus avium]|uniref:DUF421 domain-containing protein n=1 Tax=Tumebacillus avium TaxID=1903704 RepID=A0A1Y0INC5_9BACL|nr:DUF421 domain-containing protein [Tumebacillus avium]ARU62082.1 hypothetical protein CBW65_14490 [Tumebacillus avium]